MTTPAPAPSSASGPRRSAALLLAAGGVIVLVAVLVMLFGVTRPPALPSIAEAGVTPPAAVAGVVWSDGNACAALVVVRPDGSRDQVTCGDGFGDVVGWTEEGIATMSWTGVDAGVDYLDPESGDFVSHETAPEGAGVATMGDISTDWRDGTLVVRAVGSATELWTVDVSRGYRVDGGAKSPDGRWFALVDSFGRLLIVPSDGSSSPAVWSGDADLRSWPGPVWEGQAVRWETGVIFKGD